MHTLETGSDPDTKSLALEFGGAPFGTAARDDKGRAYLVSARRRGRDRRPAAAASLLARKHASGQGSSWAPPLLRAAHPARRQGRERRDVEWGRGGGVTGIRRALGRRPLPVQGHTANFSRGCSATGGVPAK